MNPPKILIVEDESIVSMEIQSRLEELGYAVSDAVYSGEEAIRSVEKLTPDLILMDINLRGELDGIDTSNQIREKFNIPIIYITAYADDETLERAKVSSPYAYIIKPIEIRELHSSVEIALFKSSMEKKLIESEKRFRSLFENATLGLYRTSISGELLMANNALIKMLGLDEDDLKFNRVISSGYVNTKRRKEFIELLNNEKIQQYVNNYGNIFGFESEWRKKDGSIIYISESARKDFDENGNVVFEGTVEDITERKMTELKLKESKEILQTVYDNVYHLIYIHDVNGKIIDVNEKVLSFHKIDRVKALNSNIMDFACDENSLEKAKFYWVKTLSGEDQLFEWKGKHLGGGSNYYVEIFLTKISFNNNDYLLANVRDITDKKISQKRLLTTQMAVEMSGAPIFFISKNADIIYVNNASVKMLGYSFDELTKMRIPDIDPNWNQNYWDNVGYPRLVKQGGDHFETVQITKFGETIPIEVNSTIIFYEGDEMIVAIITNLTERKKVADALVAAKEKAEKSNRLKTEFLASMSHEIRTPVNTILSYNSLLKDELYDLKLNQFEDIFNSISIGGQRLIRTVDSILNMSQIQTGTYEVIIQKLNLVEDILTKLFAEFKIDAANKGLQFQLEKNCTNPYLLGDSYSLGQLFTNLIDNAIKYTLTGSVIIKSYNVDDANLCIDVTDTGIGISDEFLTQIFNPFTQETQGYSRRFEGNGLGLALVKKYCSMNNAEIFIKSKKGSGSTFTVKFNNIS
ncbi:MAG: PAS domain S-box protein [Melioribacteraceae bacterium]